MFQFNLPYINVLVYYLQTAQANHTNLFAGASTVPYKGSEGSDTSAQPDRQIQLESRQKMQDWTDMEAASVDLRDSGIWKTNRSWARTWVE